MVILRLIGLVFFCCLMYACIEGEEDVWIEADGSARIVATYRVPAMLLSEKDSEQFKQSVESGIGANPHLRLVTNRVDREQGRRVIRLEIETDQIAALEDLGGKPDPNIQPTKSSRILNAILGTIEMNMEGLNVSLRREVDLKPLLDKYVGKNASAMLDDSEFRYTIHLPKGVKNSNAHEVSENGQVLRWRYNLGELKGEPIVMHMIAPVPIPWWLYVVVVAIALVILGVAWKFLGSRWRRFRGKRA